MMLGDNIRKIRKSKKISINTLAKQAEVSLGYLSDLENNKFTNPTLDKLNKLADALGVSVKEFFNGEKNVTEEITNSKNKYTLTIKEQDKLDKEAQDIINNFALSLSKEKENLKEEDYRVLEASIRSALETIKLKNKEKYTPKKYKNNREE